MVASGPVAVVPFSDSIGVFPVMPTVRLPVEMGACHAAIFTPGDEGGP